LVRSYLIYERQKGGSLVSNYYELAKEHQGQRVTITDVSGTTYTGKLVNVDSGHVYLELEQAGEQESYDRNGGYGYGYYQPPYPPSCGPSNNVVPIALAAIGGFALASAFFLW
jgi:small nuclear ribonucleoprotein (snRNP)-like protein